MSRARTCESCGFYVERTGFLTTHFECLDPEHEGSRRVKADDAACGAYRAAIDLRVKDGMFSRAISGLSKEAKGVVELANGEPREGRTASAEPAEPSVEELELAAAEARAEAAEARARAAEARAAAAEARARAARRT